MPWVTMTNRASGYTVLESDWDNITNNFAYLNRVAYVEFTANVNITATTEATANSVVTAGAITFENVPHVITFSTPRAVAPNNQNLTIVLYDSTTALGELTFLGATSPAQQTPVEQSRIITPSAASHTYNVKAFVNGGTGTIEAGAGGSGTRMPGWLSIFRIPT
jgi:hypothetical protein